MRKHLAGLIGYLLVILMTLSPLHAAESWPALKWEALIPKGWDPVKDFKGIDLSRMQDGDPRAMEALDKPKQAWDNAPSEPSLNGRKIRIAGFALPLEGEGSKVTEFLIVPYFGACIHSPPSGQPDHSCEVCQDSCRGQDDGAYLDLRYP